MKLCLGEGDKLPDRLRILLGRIQGESIVLNTAKRASENVRNGRKLFDTPCSA